MSFSLANRTFDQAIATWQASLANYSQASRLLRLHTALGSDVLLPEQFDGLECVSGLTPSRRDDAAGAGFRYELLALSTDAFLNPDDLLGTAVLVELLCADSRTALRPFHGHVTGFEQLGSNGGFARYRLTLEPWLAFLDYRRDSYVFQDKTVVEIIDEVFGDYLGEGQLVPVWRWQLVDASVYPKRSLTTQYRETDLAFVQRLLADEGLFGWFEHTGDATGDALSQHCFVIADANAACTADLGGLRFQRESATEAEDSFQRLDFSTAVGTQSVVLTSWDYASLDVRAVEQWVGDTDSAAANAVPDLSRHDTPGLYAYTDRDQGSRRALLQARALAAARNLAQAAGTVRRLGVGHRLQVVGHARIDSAAIQRGPDAASFIVLKVVHRARNNLPADFSQGLERLLGAAPVSSAVASFPLSRQRNDVLYANTSTLLPLDIAYAPAAIAPPRLAVSGVQTATVVGVAGAPITTDRDHRIKVQFHWQRGGRAQNRLTHPAGDDNAPGSEASGVWVRVAAPVAGNNWGGVFVPRIGQEVLIEFVEGDIDRPIVIGSVYNGQGSMDAPGNQVAQGAPAATANAPAWFAGNGHAGALSGLKTQALSSSQSGQGGYNQLLLDSTPMQARFDLATTQYRTQMMLGHQRAMDSNLRADPLGHGISLATDAYGAVRAGEGLLISADARSGGTHGQHQAFDASEAIDQLSDAQGLAQALADTAKKRRADLMAAAAASSSTTKPRAVRSDDTRTAPKPSLAAIASIQQSQTILRGGQATAPSPSPTGLAWSEPMIAVSAPAGILAVTPDASLWTSGTDLSLTAGHAIEILAQANHRIAAKDGIVLFTAGNPPAAGSPETLSGIQLHAAAGPVTLQAQTDRATLAARQDVRIASTTASVTMQAKTSLLLTAQGAYIRLADNNFEIHAPGNVSFKGAQKMLVGPQSARATAQSLAKAGPLEGPFNEAFQVTDKTGQPMAGFHYRIESSDGQTYEGVTDKGGNTMRVMTAKKSNLKLFLLDD